MKFLKVPMTHPWIQQMTDADLDFIEMATRLDDPKELEKALNAFYDEDFDAWAESDESAAVDIKQHSDEDDWEEVD